ncbi:hypothetical protein MADAR_309 [Blattabacterium sp. (Mastotermes darwiniensis) str. MADAR]|nr:hypothetical protein MADAR_309 [Blattabacterium sp. (Mastotermes darwiniensis) str. MADAR]
MVSGSISPFYSKYFSPFPHGTSSLSVSEEYLALPDGPGKFRQDFPCPVLIRLLFSNFSISYTGLSPSLIDFSKSFYYRKTSLFYRPTTPLWPKPQRFGLFHFRSPLLTESLLFSFPLDT